MTYQTVTLGRQGKANLRKAVRRHHEWSNYLKQREEIGIPIANIASLTKEELLGFCDYTGLHPDELIDQYLGAGKAPKAQAAKRQLASAPKAEASEPATETEPEASDIQAPINVQALAESALSEVAPFMNTKILEGLKGKINDAFEQIETRHAREMADAMANAGSAKSGAIISTAHRFPKTKRVAANIDARSLFGNGCIAYVDRWNAPDAPTPNPNHVFPDDWTVEAVTALERGRNVWLNGPRGTGKSAFGMEYAARTHRPVAVLSFHGDLEPMDLTGGKGMSDGSTNWEDGPLTAAMRRAGCVIILDEIDATPPHTLLFLNGVLNDRAITLPSGERVPCAEGVVFLACANTGGTGDASGLYAGTHVQNASTLDRFARIINIDWLAEPAERKALAQTVKLTQAQVKPLTAFAKLSRDAVKKGTNGDAISFRMLVAWAEAILDGFDATRAFEMCVQNKMQDAFGLECRQMWNAYGAKDTCAQTVRGESAITNNGSSSKASDLSAHEAELLDQLATN